MKAALAHLLTGTPLRGAFRPWTRARVPVLMLHRFSAEPRAGRTSVAELRAFLGAAVGAGWTAVGLGDLADGAAAGRWPRRAYCLTVDDGYRDFVEHAWPAFAERRVPVTLFATARFLDGRMWNWWDRVTNAFGHASAPPAAPIEGFVFPASWGDDDARRREAWGFIERMKELPETTKAAALDELERACGVARAERPPAEFAAMSWDDARALCREGLELGAHTVTHPILSRVDDRTVVREITESIEAVRAVAGAPVRCFAYPNGRDEDFDARSVEALRDAGIRCAVTTEAGFARAVTFASADGRFRVPRLAFPAGARRRGALLSGLEAAKAWVRGT